MISKVSRIERTREKLRDYTAQLQHLKSGLESYNTGATLTPAMKGRGWENVPDHVFAQQARVLIPQIVRKISDAKIILRKAGEL